MEESTIYDLLDSGLLWKWGEAIEKTEGETWFFTREQEALKELMILSAESGSEKRVDAIAHIRIKGRGGSTHHLKSEELIVLGVYS